MADSRSRKELKAELAGIRAAESRASTWLVRVSLFLLVLGWAYSEYLARSQPAATQRTSRHSNKGSAEAAGAAYDPKPVLLGAGAVLGAVRIALRFYFTRASKAIEEALLEMQPEGSAAAGKKRRSDPAKAKKRRS
ncbi:hypothetical protein BMF94_2072 [Rhodotorula taiwanensis]|uniref:Uncharacterized protein n=1 Tax=Rhodotorula taiwanensis TaxID=741276 RepID=A0A2S5BDF5_9BASI|nr:hypothetical protein BMF94_2072 [Rhodotorula taiwanensis]